MGLKDGNRTGKVKVKGSSLGGLHCIIPHLVSTPSLHQVVLTYNSYLLAGASSASVKIVISPVQAWNLLQHRTLVLDAPNGQLKKRYKKETMHRHIS